VTYYDGEHLKYKSFERDFQHKHFGFNGIYGWTRILEEWNVKPWFVDAIAIVLDSHVHNEIQYDPQKLTEVIEIPVFRDLGFRCPIHRIDHHYAHSLSFWPMGVKPTINFVFDGFGDDWMYRSVWRGDKLIDSCKSNGQNIMNSSSFGFIMSHLGAILNMKGDYLDHAGKVMALKAFGEHNSDVTSVSHIDDLDKLWDFMVLDQHINDQQYIMDYIHTAHEETEKIYLKHFREFIKPDDIVGYSGGIAQNTIINKVLRDSIPNLVIPPHANDQGLSIGAIEYLRKEYNLMALPKEGFPFMQDDEAPPRPSTKTIKDTAELLAQGKIVGWYQGHGEIGPRALGNRSILMNPFDPQGKDWINAKVKHREPFRPFGASVLEEKVSQYFYWNGPSPYMLYVMDVLEPDRFPPITHADGTCRVNTVSSEQEDYYMLLKEYEKLTGVPVLLNTSLNNGGRPIAGRIADALELYYKTDLDTLVVGDEIKNKS
tara:strand:+ start:411 stop:1865 length:1455 start_codon:yes stop_codon:yes gene_type:complete